MTLLATLVAPLLALRVALLTALRVVLLLVFRVALLLAPRACPDFEPPSFFLAELELFGVAFFVAMVRFLPLGDVPGVPNRRLLSWSRSSARAARVFAISRRSAFGSAPTC